MKSQFAGFMDVVLFDVPYSYIAYRTENFVYEEGLVDGRWVSLYYNAAGYIGASNELTRPYHMSPKQFVEPEAFDIVFNGQSINFGLVWEDTKIDRSDKRIVAHVILRHDKQNARVHIITTIDGTCAMQRVVGVENLSSKPAAISAFAPISGGVLTTGYKPSFNPMRPDLNESIWKIGYFAGTTEQGTEGDFRWRDLTTEGVFISGRYRNKRYRHPMAILHNVKAGQYFMVQLGWSGGYRFDFEYNFTWQSMPMLNMRIGLDSPAPMRVLQPDELWMGPEVHFGMTFGDLDTMINGMHCHLRNIMLPKQANLRERVVLGMGAEYCMDVPHTKAGIDYAAAIGAELFFLDAGWFVEPGVEVRGEWALWNQAVGTWEFHKDRYPNGIREIRDYCHDRNILFGVWMEPERIGKMSSIYEKHQDWLMRNNDGKINTDGLLNLAIPECAKWVENEITRIVGENELDFFRLDYNTHWPNYVGSTEIDGYLENTFVRAGQAVYGIFERLREKFPKVIFENCASGGGRTDVGMVKNFYQTWVSDFQQMPNAFKITNGMTMALPPECINRMIGGQHSYVSGDFTMGMRGLMFTQMSICHIMTDELDHYQTNPKHIAEIRHFVNLYKNFVRPMLPESEIYHHTPEISGSPATGFGILELDAQDNRKGMLGVFRLADPCDDQVTVHLKGIDKSCTYRVTSDNNRRSYTMEGWQMADEGIRIHLDSALTSELITYEAIDR